MGRFRRTRTLPVVVALTLGVIGCAHTPRTSATATPPTIATHEAPAAFDGPTEVVTGTGWTLTLPSRFEEEDAPGGARSFSNTTTTRTDALSINVVTARLEGPFATLLREVAEAHARDGMTVDPPRRLRLGETEVAELDVHSASRTLNLRVFVRAEVEGTFGAVVTCTTTSRNDATARPECDAVRQNLRVGTEFPSAPATIAARRWVGAAGRWMSVPIEWIDQTSTGPQLAAARSPPDAGEAIAVVLLDPGGVADTGRYLREVEWSMSSGATVEHRREQPTARGATLDFEVVQSRRTEGFHHRQRIAAHHGRVVIVTCGGREPVFAQRGHECDPVLRSLQLGP